MIIRIEHLKNFTTISNSTLRDSNLSWKARGLLAFFLTHSDGYQIRIDNMEMFSKHDGPTSVSSGVKELKLAGYMSFQRRRDPVTKSWLPGEWIVSEEPAMDTESLTPEKPDPGKPYVRESLPQENIGLYKKDQKERIIKKKERSNKRKDFFADSKFDPEDLPSHLGNNKAVAEAWSRFVQSRKEIKKRITPVAYKMLIKKMLAHSPEEVVAALDTSSERGYTGVFFNDNPPAKVHTVQGDMFPVKLDPDAQRLADFAASVLGNELIRPRAIQDIVNQMRVFYGTADKFRYQYDPLKRMGPTEHYTWDKFFREWLEFLEEKQQSGFTLQSVRNLQQSDTRWREYLKQCEEYTGYDWNTGKRRE